jgi:hypothetical protein
MTCKPLFALVTLLALASPLAAQRRAASDTAVRITWGGFVDAYYAWDFGEPPTLDRSFDGGVPFTTQPTRHNEFNVNLAFVEAKLEGSRVHGRFAAQMGTSVQSNYSGEPTVGVFSGPLLSRLIQEAYAGARVAENVWIDGGVFFSHMGMESWISRDNPTYTRSLVAEYSPYYSSGVRGIWQATPKLTAHLHVVNGWQNISENNTGKGAGIRVDYAPTATTALSYYNFFSNEAGNLLRIFNGVGGKLTSGAVTFLGQVDVGNQEGNSWYGFTAIGRFQVNPRGAVAVRLERYADEDGVIIATGPGNGPFEGNGASIGFDFAPIPRLLWRSEVRGFMNDSEIFPSPSGGPKDNSVFVVTSLGLTF